MPRAATFPFYTASPEKAETTEWLLHGSDGKIQPLPASIPDWDPEQDLIVQVQPAVDGTGILEDVQLGQGSGLRLSLSWYCGATQLRGVGRTLEIPADGSTFAQPLECRVRGTDVGGSVDFTLAVVLTRSEGGNSLSPNRPGSMLWSETRSIALEGIGGRFPVQWVDFSADRNLPDGAAWWLDWDPNELSHGVGRGIRLFLNSEHDRLQVSMDDPESDAARVVFDTIYFDVGRTLLTGALLNEDFVAAPEAYENGTIGAEIRRLLDALYSAPLEHLRDRCLHRRFRFELELQDSLSLLGGAD